MRSDLVLVIGMICLTVLAIYSAHIFGGDIAKVIIGGAMTIIAAICGVSYHVALKKNKNGQ
jgi:hypothetical protein